MYEKNESYFIKDLSILYIDNNSLSKQNILKTLHLICNNIYTCSSYDEAQRIIHKQNINIIISDLEIGNLSIFSDLLDKLDGNNLKTIIISSTLKSNDLLQCIKFNITDYILKPSSFDELYYSIHKAFNELYSMSKIELYLCNDISYNISTKTLYKNHKTLSHNLSYNEILLLELLVHNSNRFLSKDEIMQNLWSHSLELSESALKNILNKVRKIIGKENIINVSGLGYRLNKQAVPTITL